MQNLLSEDRLQSKPKFSLKAQLSNELNGAICRSIPTFKANVVRKVLGLTETKKI